MLSRSLRSRRQPPLQPKSWAAIRRAVTERDAGVCALCSADTTAQQMEFLELAVTSKWAALAHARNCGVPAARAFQGPWFDVDHILPRVESGTDELENLRTLCLPCHGAETARLRQRRPRSWRNLRPYA